MERKHWIALYFWIALLSACVTPLPPVANQSGPPQTVTPAMVRADEAKSGTALSIPIPATNKDAELFLQALHQVAGPFNQEASSAARQKLETLLSDSPQGQWSEAARVTLRLIGELDTYRQRLSSEQDMVQKLATDRKRTLQEYEQVKKELRLLNEKYQTELAELQQENEQLKKDLQLLKNLEMQLDRREKLLR
jgi:hypothetical protein